MDVKILTVNDEEVELRDLDEEDDLQPADELNIAQQTDTEEEQVESFE